MFKKILIFGAGYLLGGYVMHNTLYKRASKICIGQYEEELKNLEKEKETSKTEKES
mgnify:CR=1 FL=1